METHYYTS